MEQLRRRLTYANVMATIAAFVAVAGSTAYASDHLGRDSVGTVQLRLNSVTQAEHAANADSAASAAIRSGVRIRRNLTGRNQLAAGR
jgi:hypothetical protein